MKGIVLAGGKSTRFDHKLYLSTKQGVNVVLAAGRCLVDAGLRETDVVYCVNKHDAVLRDIIYNAMPKADILIDEHAGLGRTLDVLSEHDRVVMCGDNVYGSYTVHCMRKMINLGMIIEARAATNILVTNDDARELDRYDLNRGLWCKRDDDSAAAFATLTTPWLIPRGFKLGNQSVIEFFNSHKARRWSIDDSDWADLGTKSGVEKYYARY